MEDSNICFFAKKKKIIFIQQKSGHIKWQLQRNDKSKNFALRI